MHRACTNNPLKSDRRKLDDMAGKTNIDEFFLCPCKKQLFHLTKSAIIQIAKTVQCIEPVDTEDLGKVLMQLKTGVVVLGLATSHNEEWKLKQVRGVDQTPYPSQLHGASLATAMQRPCRPLLSKKFYIFTDGSHTHTWQPWPPPVASELSSNDHLRVWLYIHMYTIIYIYNYIYIVHT